jgi:cytochrome c biogenesis protein CcdA
MDPHQSAPQTNTLGNASLGLGLASAALVFGIGLCAIVGGQQGWIWLTGTVLFICGASSAFLGLLASILGLGGLFGANRSRATAVVGLVTGVLGMCIFIWVLSAFGAG